MASIKKQNQSSSTNGVIFIMLSTIPDHVENLIYGDRDQLSFTITDHTHILKTRAI